MMKKNKFKIFFLLACISLFSCSSNEEEVIVYEKIIERGLKKVAESKTKASKQASLESVPI